MGKIILIFWIIKDLEKNSLALYRREHYGNSYLKTVLWHVLEVAGSGCNTMKRTLNSSPTASTIALPQIISAVDSRCSWLGTYIIGTRKHLPKSSEGTHKLNCDTIQNKKTAVMNS